MRLPTTFVLLRLGSLHSALCEHLLFAPPPSPFSANVMIRVVHGRLSSHGFPVRAVGSFLFSRPPSLILHGRRERWTQS